MFSSCFDLCSQPTPLFQRYLSRHPTQTTERSSQNLRIPQKVSLKSMRSLKMVKSAKNLSQNTTEPLSPRVSLKSIDSFRKNTPQNNKTFEPFRNPFEKVENTKVNVSNASVRKQQTEAKVYFHFEPSIAQKEEESYKNSMEESLPIPTIQIHSEDQVLVNQSETSSLVFGTPMLSTIKQSQKQDLKSTHTTGQRLLIQRSFMKPKSVVSMMSSKSDNDSILLERPSNLFELKDFF